LNLSFQNIDWFCAGIDLAQETPVVELSQLDFIEPFAVIYLGQFLRACNKTPQMRCRAGTPVPAGTP
jgi:hypothetical protein